MRLTPVRDEENRVKQREKLNCDAVAQSQTIQQVILELTWPLIFDRVVERKWGPLHN